MTEIIGDNVLSKIRNAKNGNDLISQLDKILNKTPDIEYHRGIIHGFCLSLVTMGIIDSSEALDIIYTFRGE